MVKSLFSPSWYRVAPLRLRLRGHAEIHRQRFRGEIWYVLQDHQTGRFNRMSPSANLMLSLMDGRRTIAEVWDMVGQRAGDDPPTQDEVIQLLAQLHSADLLQGEILPDFQELGDRSEEQTRRNLLNRLRNPMALRLPLFDPDRFLTLAMPLVKPLFTVYGFLAWLALVVSGLVLAALNWPELTADGTDRLLSAQNLALIVVTYPVIKALHEAGHAFATKAFGGAVHEVGVMLLILVPAPYVDATASTAFRERWRRMVVGGAGIMVEFALAAFALIFWLNAEPGLARATAFNVMLIGGVSTLLFNGNPLLRFDAYYVLSDLIEIPNLGTKANKYFWYLCEHYLLGGEGLENPASAPGEHKWLFVYAVLSFTYRIVLSLSIAAVVATKLFFVGVLLAMLSLAGTFLMPVFKGAKFLATSPRLAGHRRRAMLTSGGIVAVVLAAIFALPLPYGTVAEGVVWIPDQAEVRAGTSGIVAQILAQPGSEVKSGTPLLQLEDPSLGGRADVLKAQKSELQLQYDGVRYSDLVQAQVLQEEIKHVDGTLQVMTKRAADLVVRAGNDGRFVLPNSTDLEGRFLKEGDLVGYVVGPEKPTLRVVVAQDDVDLVRRRTGEVEVRYAADFDHVVPGRISREVPAAQLDLPSLALSTQGGGSIALDAHADHPQALQGLFVFDVTPNADAAQVLLGSRVYVRFDYGREAIAWRMMRGLRQVFLSRFDV